MNVGCITFIVFIAPVLTLLALGIGLCQKVVGIVLDFIACLLHIGIILYYVFFIIRGTIYADIVNAEIVLQIVPPIALSLCALACLVCMVDCCRHVWVTRRGGDDHSSESGTSYVPLQGSKHIDSDSDDSD